MSESDSISHVEFNPSIFESSFVLQSTPDSNLLRAANVELNATVKRKELSTPHQRYMTRLIEAFERLTTNRQLLKEKLETQDKVLAARTERKSGKRFVLGIASKSEMYQKIKVIEDAVAAKKKRKISDRDRDRFRKI